MAFQNGRTVKVYQGDSSTGTLIAGARTKSLTINNESIDVTTDDASGFRTLLSDVATKSVDVSVEGLLFDDAVLSIAANGTGLLAEHTLDIEGIGEINGDFFLNSFESGAEYNGSITFTASLQSSGAYTYTAG